MAPTCRMPDLGCNEHVRWEFAQLRDAVSGTSRLLLGESEDILGCMASNKSWVASYTHVVVLQLQVAMLDLWICCYRLRQRHGTTTGPAMPDRAVGAPIPLPRSPAHSFLPPSEPGVRHAT